MSLEEVYQRNKEHRIHRAGWLRAAVLGVNDGLVSTASLMIGVAAAQATSFIATAGLAGIAAGAMSMAVGEYVSVRSQVDIEDSDRVLEQEHLRIDPEGELLELIEIYKKRGLDENLARQVAVQMTEFNALETHLRDELGQFEHTKARPLQAAIASAISFTFGGLIPFVGVFAPTLGTKTWSILIFTIIGLHVAGFASGKVAGTAIFPAMMRVVVGGCLGMAITAGIGSLVHIAGI